MKLYLEKDNGEKIELKEITDANKDSEMLFFFLNTRVIKADREALESELSRKTGKRCMVLDGLFVDKIMGV